MFSLRNFVKKGLLDAVGKLADYQVILNAAGWLEKGVLTEEDLAELQAAIEAREAALEASVEEATPESATDGTDDSDDVTDVPDAPDDSPEEGGAEDVPGD